MPDWERQAEIFFYHFDSLGWKNTNGAKVERWDSRANLWIFEKLNKNGNGTAKGYNGGDVTGPAGESKASEPGNIFDRPTEELEDFINSLQFGG